MAPTILFAWNIPGVYLLAATIPPMTRPVLGIRTSSLEYHPVDHRIRIPILRRKFRQSSSNAVICVLGTEREGRFSRHGNLVCLVGNGSLSCQIVAFRPSVVSSMRLCLHHIRLTRSLGTLLASSNSARFGNIPDSSSSTPCAAFDLF